MATHYLGNPITIDLTVTDEATGDSTNAATIGLVITLPDGTTSAQTPTSSDTGDYYVNYSPPVAGHYTYVWTTTNPNGTVFGSFDVVSGQRALDSTSLRDLVDEILDILHGVTGDLEQVTELTENITVSDTSFSVDDALQVSRGLIEIGDELMWVKTTDQTVNSVTLSSFGRGFRRSEAVAHQSGDMVVNDPLFPRAVVKTAISECLSAIYPQLFAVLTDESNKSSAVKTTYPLPSNVAWVIGVEWQTIGPSGAWRRVKRWKFNPTSDSTAYPSGKSIDILDPVAPGRTIKVTYAAAPTPLTDDGDTLGGIGLDDGVRDILVYGAAARLLFGVEAGRLGTNAVEESDRSKVIPAGAAISVAKSYMQMYELRLADERSRLLSTYPTTAHMTR